MLGEPAGFRLTEMLTPRVDRGVADLVLLGYLGHRRAIRFGINVGYQLLSGFVPFAASLSEANRGGG